MAITITNDSATIGTTEYFLVADGTTASYQTGDGILEVLLDLSNLAAGDQFEVKIYEKVNGGTAKPIYRATFTGAQSDHWVSPSFVVGDGWEISLKKLAGTDRSIGWSRRLVA